MCLDSVTEVFKQPVNKEEVYVGYKVGYSKDGKTFSSNNNYYRPFNEWLPAALDDFDPCRPQKYQLGFHIFRSEEGAKAYRGTSEWFIVKVQYRGILATGWQYGYEVVVAEEILIEYPGEDCVSCCYSSYLARYE